MEKEVKLLISAHHDEESKKIFDECLPAILRSVPRDVYHVSEEEIQRLRMENFQSNNKVKDDIFAHSLDLYD